MFTDNKTELHVDKLDRETSVLISGYLEEKGCGVFNRNENKNTMLIFQLAEEFVSFKCIPTGGAAERSVHTDVADFDTMNVIKGFLVSDGHNLLFSDCGCDKNGVVYICIKRNEQFPGFCKLHLSQKCYDRLQKRMHVMNKAENFKQVFASVIKQGDNLLISSKLMKKKFNGSVLPPPEKFDNPLFVINGPAITFSHMDMKTDIVDCFEFNEWPREAKIWKERRRKHNWPSKDILDRLEKEVHCYVVPKGNNLSEDFAVEWSFSFAEIERELMWNMNDTQFKCYIFLKRIIKEMKERIASLETISTYQIKNVMFWMCEIIPEHEWKIENLLRYISLGLMKLRNCIHLVYNSYYFIPEMNLMRSVKLSAQEKREIMEILTIDLHSEDVYHAFQNLKMTTSDVNRQTILEMITFEKRLLFLIHFGRRCSDEAHTQFFNKILSRFPEWNYVSTCLAITKANRSLRGLLDAQCINNRKVKTEVKAAERNDNINEIVENMRSAYQIDYLTTSLYIALVFNYSKRYLDVQNELKPKLLNMSRKLYQYKESLYYFVLNSAKVYRVSEDVSCLSKDRQNFVSNFIFLPEEEILPFPLKLHLFLIQGYNPSVIAFVLAYFLLFTSQHYLGLTSELEATRKLLRSAVLNSKFHKLFFFHLYLLGYSFYITGDMKEAYYWFAQSAIQKPSRLNAALYQIAIIINDLILLRK